MARCIMVQGTMSSAGKSLLAAGLCRIFKQDGLRCAPFKSQNMALNSFITKDGLEMGRAQVMQAQAAGVEPDVRMNPILLKPTGDTGSQVIVNGEVLGQMSAADYFRMKKTLIPHILKAYDELAELMGGRPIRRDRAGGGRQPGGDQPEGRRHCEHGPGQTGQCPGAAGRRH